jgi:3-oxoacyl-[acyl-carrier protein] reductase
MGVQGRVAVITGSARNIGRACAIELAKQGAKVVVNARSQDKVDQVVDEIRSFEGVAASSYNSVATPEGCEGIIADAVKAFGTVDIVVNNAAISSYKFIQDLEDDEWLQVLNTDLTGYFRMTKAALPYMIENQWGRFVNMSSHAGLTGTSMRAAYAAAKGGVHAFTKATAKEYGKYNITANAIAPFTTQPEQDSNPQHFGAMYTQQPEAFAAQNTAVSLAGMAIPTYAGPETVAAMVAFFASEEAWYITGQVISVGGGRWMG